MKETKSISEKEISAFEEKIGFEVPSDLRTFLLKYNGCIIPDLFKDYRVLPIKEANAKIHPGILFGIETGDRFSDILYWMERYGEELFEHTLIIGNTTEQGLLLLICEGENAGVYYWDDTCEFESSKENGNVYRIADTFGDFLKKLG